MAKNHAGQLDVIAVAAAVIGWDDRHAQREVNHLFHFYPSKCQEIRSFSASLHYIQVKMKLFLISVDTL